MIRLGDDCEYTILIADLIATLSVLDKDGCFTLKLWTHGRDLPFKFENDCDFEFLQEGIRIEDSEAVMYVFYDEIEYIRVDKE